MTRLFGFPHTRTLRAIVPLVTTSALLFAFSLLVANATDPPGDASTSVQNERAFQRDLELANIRAQMLAVLRVDDLRLREAQAALDAAKNERSKATHQAECEAIAESRSRLYAQLVVNRLSLDALYAPPAVRKRLDDLARLIETDQKAKSAATSAAQFAAEIAVRLRDAETARTVGRLLVAAEHLRQIGKPDTAARISREADLLESEFKATLQKGRERLAKPVTEEPSAIELNPQTVQRQSELAKARLAILQELQAIAAESRTAQSDLEAANAAQQRAALQPELQRLKPDQRQAQQQAMLDHQQRQKAALQAKLQNLAALRSQRYVQLAVNRWSMDASHASPDVGKRIAEGLARQLKAGDAETIRTVGRLLMAAEHFRQIGKADAAARVSKEADLLEREVAVMLQAGKERSTETPGDSAQPKPDRAPAKKVIELRLLDNEQVLVNRRGKIMLDEFKNRLGDAMANYKQQGVQPGAVCVHLSAAEDVSCDRFEKLVVDCWKNRIEHYVLKIEAIYLDPVPRDKRLENAPPINVRFSLRREADALPEEALPPFPVRLLAKEDGSLAGVRVNEIQLRSVVQLRTWAVELKHRAGGPHAPLTAEFDTDEKLAFKHLAEAVLAMSVQMDPFHKLVPLIENVVPIRIPDDGEQFKELEDRLAPPDDRKASPRLNVEVDGPTKPAGD